MSETKKKMCRKTKKFVCTINGKKKNKEIVVIIMKLKLRDQMSVYR